MGLTVPTVGRILQGSFNNLGNPTMKEYKSLSHTTWDCKYHVVFIPKRRKKVIYGQLRQHLGQIFHELAGYKEWIA
jgi:hypothetical protein